LVFTSIEDFSFTGLWGKMKCPLKHLGTSSSLIQREEFHVFVGAVINGSVLDRRLYFFNSKTTCVRHKRL